MLAPHFRQADYPDMLDQVADQLPALQRRIVLGPEARAMALRMLDEFKLGIDEVDALTGPLLGRAKSATLKTCTEGSPS